MERLTFDGNFCDIAMCQETPGGSFCEDGYCSQRRVWERLKAYEDMEEQGRLVVLPFIPHSAMMDVSDPANPSLMNNVRLAVAWTSSSGIVFHSPYEFFSQGIKRGYIQPISQKTEEAGVDIGREG